MATAWINERFEKRVRETGGKEVGSGEKISRYLGAGGWMGHVAEFKSAFTPVGFGQRK